MSQRSPIPPAPSPSDPATSRRGFLAAGLSASGLGLGAAQQPPSSTTKSGGVQYRTLGKTGLKVSSLGFGCMITSDASVIQRAADLGVTYFDTARVYQNGNNERMVGAALKSRRKDVVISSKTVGRSSPEALGDLNMSLRELGTDYLDIWFLHALSGSGQLTPGLLSAIAMAKKSGKIRFAGVSTHQGQSVVIREAITSGAIDVVMTAYNFAMEQRLTPLLETASKAGVGVVAMKVMAGGRRNPGFYPTPGSLRSLFKREGALLAALKWVLMNPVVGAAIPSMVDNDQLEENIKAMTQPFGEADYKVLSAHLEQIRPFYCRMCNECEGSCSQGLPVADVLRYLTYADGYGQFGLGREHFQTLPPKQAAVRCGDCPACTVKCPFGVEVAACLSRAQDLFA